MMMWDLAIPITILQVMKMAKTTEKKQDFIALISMMSNNELNDYIKRHGHGPKPVVMCRTIDKKEKSDENAS